MTRFDTEHWRLSTGYAVLMLFTSTAATLATAETVVRELPMPPLAFGAVALGCFIVLLGVLWSFRNTAARYDKPDPGAHT